MTIRFCPVCGAKDCVNFDAEETAFVTLDSEGEEAEPKPCAVYTFECCGRSVAVLTEREASL